MFSKFSFPILALVFTVSATAARADVVPFGTNEPYPFVEPEVIPEAMCRALTAECPKGAALTALAGRLKKYASLLRALNSNNRDEARRAEEQLNRLLNALRPSELAAILEAFRCVIMNGGSSYPAQTRSRIAVLYQRFGYAGVETPVCGNEPETIDLVGLEPTAHPGDDERFPCTDKRFRLRSPGAGSCSAARAALREEYYRVALRMPAEESCYKYWKADPGLTELVSGPDLSSLSCCIDAERCQFVTPDLEFRVFEYFRNELDQMDCVRADCNSRKGVFLATLPAGAAAMYGVIDEYKLGKSDSCEESGNIVYCAFPKGIEPPPANSPDFGPPPPSIGNEGGPVPVAAPPLPEPPPMPPPEVRSVLIR